LRCRPASSVCGWVSSSPECVVPVPASRRCSVIVNSRPIASCWLTCLRSRGAGRLHSGPPASYRASCVVPSVEHSSPISSTLVRSFPHPRVAWWCLTFIRHLLYLLLSLSRATPLLPESKSRETASLRRATQHQSKPEWPALLALQHSCNPNGLCTPHCAHRVLRRVRVPLHAPPASPPPLCQPPRVPMFLGNRR